MMRMPISIDSRQGEGSSMCSLSGQLESNFRQHFCFQSANREGTQPRCDSNSPRRQVDSCSDPFAGIVGLALAHDFNNILDVISSNAYLALTDTCIPETARACLQAISIASEEATEVVSRLMKFGRTHTVAMRAVQINESIAGVLQFVRPMLREGIRLKTELSQALPMLEADPVEIDQVLVNLIVNALDAMPQGGELIISTGFAEIGETESKNDQAMGRFVFISISDTGIGIPRDAQSQIFEPFFTTKEEGTGLGLWSAYEIVRQHGGDIKVKSELGNGTNFTISLPAK